MFTTIKNIKTSQLAVLKVQLDNMYMDNTNMVNKNRTIIKTVSKNYSPIYYPIYYKGCSKNFSISNPKIKNLENLKKHLDIIFSHY